jgi:uracil-DNA glycosylase
MFTVPSGWSCVLQDEITKPYYNELLQFLTKQYSETTIYPRKENVFKALELTPFNEVKVVILGQDPYHGENQAHGLSFSVERGEKIPPSLRNMYKELNDDLGIEPATHGNLTSWAKQGVLLLNTVLTVQAGKANSHKNKGWEQFTDRIIVELGRRSEPVIFVLWGAPAQKKEMLIKQYPQHKIIKSPHPSPLSAYRGFFGSKPYSTINTILKEKINWAIM